MWAQRVQYQKYLQCFCPHRSQVIVSKVLPNIELNCFKPPFLSLSQPTMSNKIPYQLKGQIFPWISHLGGEWKIYFHEEESPLDHDDMTWRVKKLSYICPSACRQKCAGTGFGVCYVQTMSQRRPWHHKLLQSLLKAAHCFDLLLFVSRQQLHRLSNQAANAKWGQSGHRHGDLMRGLWFPCLSQAVSHPQCFHVFPEI